MNRLRLTQDHRISVRRLRFVQILALGMMLLHAGAARAQQAFDFKNHPFFKQLVGGWTAEGEGRSARGKPEKFKVEWKAQSPDATSFTIEGKIESGGKTTSYKKTFTHTESGTFQAVYQPDISSTDTQTYSVVLARDGSQMEMTLPLGKKAKQVIVDAFKGIGHDTLEYKLTVTDATGAMTYSSKSVSKKKKS